MVFCVVVGGFVCDLLGVLCLVYCRFGALFVALLVRLFCVPFFTVFVRGLLGTLCVICYRFDVPCLFAVLCLVC